MSAAHAIFRGAASVAPFRSAPELAERWGLPVLPLDGKRPLFAKWQRLGCAPRIVTQWAKEFPTANVGLKTGKRSRLTVIDIDAPEQREAVIELCGESPLEVTTPRGGCHLYYLHAGERNRAGIVAGVDVRGEGGLVAAPPSIRWDDGRLYAFAANDWNALPDLPPIRPGALAEMDRMGCPAPLSAPETGRRNNSLFRTLMVHAPQAGDVDALEAFGAAINAYLPDPLSADEVRKTARSAWRYEVEGRNYLGAGKTREAEMDLMRESPNAALLLRVLELSHPPSRQSFAISPKAMEAAGKIGKWDAKKYRAVRDELVERGLLVRVSKGGTKPGDPATFRWAAGRGAISPTIYLHGSCLGEGE